MKNKTKNKSRRSSGETPKYTERGYDILTWTLAGALALIVLGAVGYGIVNSSRLATKVPSLSEPQRAAPMALPRRDPRDPDTTGSGSGR